MANDSQRNKARATFGKTFFENSKALPQPKNAAVALQKRANARPIPTYKVGGVVKKQNGGRSPEADDVLMSTPRGQRMLEEQKRREREAAAKAKAEAAKRAKADVLLGIPAQKEGGRANEDFTGLMKKAASRAAAKGNPVMKQGGATKDYIEKRVNARMEAGNYKDGGAVKDRMESRMREAERKYKIALAKGKNEGIAKAKFERRNADIADDYAKKTKADRTGTKAAEQAAKAALKEARRTDGASIAKRDFDKSMMEKASKDIAPKVDVAATIKGVGGLGAMPSAAPKAAATKAATPARKAPVVRQARPAGGQSLANANRPTGSVTAAPVPRPAGAAPSGVNAAFFKPKGGAPTGAEGAKGLKLKPAAPKEEAVKPGVATKAARDASRVARLANVRGKSTVVAPKPNIPEAKDLGSKKPNWGKYMMGAQSSGVPVKRAAGGAGKVRKGQMKGC